MRVSFKESASNISHMKGPQKFQNGLINTKFLKKIYSLGKEIQMKKVEHSSLKEFKDWFFVLLQIWFGKTLWEHVNKAGEGSKVIAWAIVKESCFPSATFAY